MINAPLLQKALDHIEAHPDEHDQAHYASRTSGCGTAYCLAGHVAVIEGWTPIFRHGVTATMAFQRDHVNRLANDIASEALGLNTVDAGVLFAAGNTRNDLWTMAERLTDGAITRPTAP